MKTTHTINDVEQFLANIKSDAAPGSVQQLTEGHTSQVFSYETLSGGKRVLRLRESKKDLQADQYAFQNFSQNLPIPAVIGIGMFDNTTHYAITPLIEGQTLNTLSQDSFNVVSKDVKKMIAKTFKTDISSTTGYGDPDFESGNASSLTWKDSLKSELATLNVEKLRQSAANIGLPEDSVDALVQQFNNYLPYVSEHRRLLHGDPGGDNVIIRNDTVVALLDWEQMAYGDWLRDFSRFEYWNMNDYGDAKVFAERYGLEAENIPERKAVYWAINALRGIEFADRDKSEKVAIWLRKNLDRIVTAA